jgi:hypothetical protein
MRHRTMSVRRGAIVGAFLVVAAALAGTVIAGQFQSPDPREFERDLASGKSMRVADIAATDGKSARGVFAQITDAGMVCFWDAASATAQQLGGGCNSAADPLGGTAVSASLAYEGGPALEDVKDARLIGLAAPAAKSVAIVMTDASSRVVRLRRTRIGADVFQAFGFRVSERDLAGGIGPAAIVAYDASGAEIGRQPTGIG